MEIVNLEKQTKNKIPKKSCKVRDRPAFLNSPEKNGI